MPPSEQVLPPDVDVPFLGLFDSPSIPSPAGFVSLARNVVLESGAWRTRPGIAELGTGLPSSPIQGVHMHQELDGTLHPCAFVAGDLWVYNATDDDWDQYDLSSFSITMSPSQRVTMASYRGNLIIADGVTRPVMWQPSRSGATAWTRLTEAPIASGVCVYYDKVFFFGLTNAGDENVFEWSDEGDPTDGYEDDNQDWEFAQTDTGPVVGLVPLNEQMLVFKHHSIARITGAVGEEFRTDAVREGVSETEGVASHRCVVVADGDVYYMSQSGPRVIPGGGQRIILAEGQGGPIPPGASMIGEAFKRFDRNKLNQCVSFFDPVRRQIVWLWPKVNETTVRAGLLYTVEDQGWSEIEWPAGYDFRAAAVYEESDGTREVALATADGSVYLYGGYESDDGTAIDQMVRSRVFGLGQPLTQQRLAQVEFSIEGANNLRINTRPRINGVTLSGRNIRHTIGNGLNRYRRQLNNLGYQTGWELEVDRGTMVLRQSIAFHTVASNPATA